MDGSGPDCNGMYRMGRKGAVRTVAVRTGWVRQECPGVDRGGMVGIAKDGIGRNGVGRFVVDSKG